MSNIFVGELTDSYYLESDHYVPERILKKINIITSLMIENGLNEFYKSYEHFLDTVYVDHYYYKSDGEIKLDQMTMLQLKRAVYLVLCLYGMAVIVFMCEKAYEIIIYKWNSMRNRK